MKTGCWAIALVVLAIGVAWAAEPAVQSDEEQPAAGLSGTTRDLERNVALGAALTMRAGTPAEFEEVSLLAERGLAAARAAVAEHPDSAEAHYLLGSWLLYGYRVVEVRSISFDPRQGERAELLPKVVLGLSEDLEEGLAALLRATELAPQNGQYLLDRAAALLDCERPLQAMAILKAAWAGEPELSPLDKMEAGLLLSDIHAYEGQLRQAREWIYAALALDAAAARAVSRLRHLDAAQAAAIAVEEEALEEILETEDEVIIYDTEGEAKFRTEEETGGEEGHL
ncbi:MAG: hypothetical protein JSV79_02865 [Armatimonadota bacterium]|nr:MAG: hypothetical protein JSV79_02865 [Armatimonadota bacterium]